MCIIFRNSVLVFVVVGVKVANKPGAILDVCRPIGPVQTSVYGQSYCVVTNDLEFADRAYSNLPLKAHTDTTYLRNSAG